MNTAQQVIAAAARLVGKGWAEYYVNKHGNTCLRLTQEGQRHVGNDGEIGLLRKEMLNYERSRNHS